MYTGARLGLFDIFSEKLRDPSGAPLGFAKNAMAALSPGQGAHNQNV